MEAEKYELAKKAYLNHARGRIKPLRLCGIDEAVVEMIIEAKVLAGLAKNVTDPTYPFPATAIYYSTHWNKNNWQKALNRLQRLPDDSLRKRQYDHNLIGKLAEFLDLDYEPSKAL